MNKERLEEVVFKILSGTNAYLNFDADGIASLRTEMLDHLLTLHREWLEERVKKMEGMKLNTGIVDCGRPGGIACPGCANCGQQEMCVCDTYNEALQTLIDADRKEIEELSINETV